mgnify:CR=1 FL=1
MYNKEQEIADKVKYIISGIMAIPESDIFDTDQLTWDIAMER